MSTGLMSCVRENSPPLEQDMNATSGPLSLPEISTANMSMAVTSTPVVINTTTNSDGGNSTAGTGAAPNAETQKRRRFHPLRNLRRIFRRRTITTPTEAPTTSTVPQQPTSSNSEKNLRSATLSSISSVVSASSPSSPLSHQQIQDAYSSQSLPKSKTYSITAAIGASLLGGDALSTKSKAKQQQQKQLRDQTSSGATIHDNDMYTTTTSSTSAYHHSHHTQNYARHTYVVPGSVPQRQSLGVAVLPSAMNRSFFNERQKLRSVGDSSQDLDSSGNGSGNNIDSNIVGHANGNNSNGEMSDSQRSLSEGRLVDSDYTNDQLSQSHDSVFSESATASSLSSVLKAELADVLRKRRNRPDASDEDLGLPRSPASPQRRAEHQRKTCSNSHNTTTSTTTGNQSEVSSLSLLSMNSTDGEEFFSATSANNSNISAQSIIRPKRADLLRRSTSENFSNTNDEVDLFDSNWQRLSHSAAKHKMAIRPAKKKGPSRQHRRTLETSIPEAIEETPKTLSKRNLDVVDDTKARTRSLPPSANSKLMELHADEKKYTATTISAGTAPAVDTSANFIKSTKPEKLQELNTITQTSSANSNMFGLRALTAKASSIFDPKEPVANATAPNSMSNLKNQEVEHTTSMETTESGFLRRLIQRNSKRTISKTNTTDEELDFNESMPKKIQISSSAIDTTNRSSMASTSALKKSRSAMGYSQNVEETRKDIKREIISEGANGINAMMSSYLVSTNTAVPTKETPINQQQKPKSGPAARQRYIPQDIAGENTLERKAAAAETAAEISSDSSAAAASLATKSALSKPAAGELFQSTSIIREIRAAQLYNSIDVSPPKADQHYEKKPKFVGLSAFQQKISRSNDAVARSSNSSLEAVTGEINYRDFEQKQRKLVEKSRSFRTYNESRDTIATTTANMPSLPDLSLNLNLSVPTYNEFILKEKSYHATPSPPDQSVSLGFEINDNNLVKPNTVRAGSANNVSHSHTRNTVPATTRLLTPATVLPQLSPTNSCNRNINEIEQNIDMIVKSPFISVLRNSVTYSDEALTGTAEAVEPTTSIAMNQVPTKTPAPQKTRPKVLELKESITREEDKMTPTTAAVPLREKAKVSSSAAGSAANDQIITKETLERKSAPAATTTKVISNAKVMKRNTSLTETVVDDVRTDVPEFMKIQLNRVDPARMAKTNVVLAKNIKETSPSKDAAVRTAASTENLSMRRLSNESVDINEKQFNSPTTDAPMNITAVNEAVNRQARTSSSSPPSSSSIVKKSTSVSNGLNVSSSTVSSTVVNNAGPTTAVNTNANKPRNIITSPVSNGNTTLNRNGFATTLYSSATEPNRNSSANVNRTTNANNNIQSNNKTYTNGNSDLPPKSPVKKIATPLISAASSPIEESVVLRPQTYDEVGTSQTLTDVKLSLQHRKLLFMQDEQAQTVRKIEEIRNERKKSINDEVVFRKSITKSEEKLEAVVSPTRTEPNPEHIVTLRKKSFGAANTSGIPISNNTNNNNNNNGKEDATPELMKVFARRSLKIKDEDLAALTDKIMNTNGNVVATTKVSNNAANSNNITAVVPTNGNSTGNTLKKLQQQSTQTVIQQQNVDSDKENQSASEEKLDKLTKADVAIEQTHNNSKSATTTIANVSNSNRNSLADFRNGVQHKNGLTVQHHNNNNNHSNNNNNHNNNTNTMTSATTTNKSGLPVARSFRAMSTNLSSVSNNNNGLSAATKGTLERKSLNYIKPTETQNVSAFAAVGSSKTIERSATVSEFKGIHQRRAEWEQRAKEAFK